MCLILSFLKNTDCTYTVTVLRNLKRKKQQWRRQALLLLLLLAAAATGVVSYIK